MNEPLTSPTPTALKNEPAKRSSPCSVWLGRVCAWLKDPFRIRRNIDADWQSFYAMSEEELRAEWDRLLDERPTGDRFRRLCQFFAMHWRFGKRPNADAVARRAKD